MAGARVRGSGDGGRERLVVLTVLAVLSFWLGQYPVGPGTVLRILAGQVAPIPVTWSPVAQTAVLQVRLPEIP